MDFSLTHNIYLRGQVLYGIRLANRFENDLVNELRDDFTGIPGVNIDTRLGHGLSIKLAVGFRF